MQRILIALLICISFGAISLAFFKSKPPHSAEELALSASQGSYRVLEKAITDTDPKERVRAVQALLKLGTDESVELLRAVVRDKSVVVRTALVQGIPQLPESKALPLLLELLNDPEFGVVRDCLKCSERFTVKSYNYAYEASLKQKLATIEECRQDIRRKLSVVQ